MSVNKNTLNIKLFTSIAVVCTTVMFVFGYANQSLGWNALEFHSWQLLTAHFVHYDFKHLLTNMLGLGILLYLFPASFKSNLIGIVFAIILIDLYLWLLQVEYYVGYSGLLYVIPGLALAKNISLKKYTQAVLIVLIYSVYVLISPDVVNISNQHLWKPLKQAHLLGFVGGFLSSLISFQHCFERQPT